MGRIRWRSDSARIHRRGRAIGVLDVQRQPGTRGGEPGSAIQVHPEWRGGDAGKSVIQADVARVGRCQQRLGRHRAAVHTGAAHRASLDRTQLRGRELDPVTPGRDSVTGETAARCGAVVRANGAGEAGRGRAGGAAYAEPCTPHPSVDSHCPRHRGFVSRATSCSTRSRAESHDDGDLLLSSGSRAANDTGPWRWRHARTGDHDHAGHRSFRPGNRAAAAGTRPVSKMKVRAVWTKCSRSNDDPSTAPP